MRNENIDIDSVREILESREGEKYGISGGIGDSLENAVIFDDSFTDMEATHVEYDIVGVICDSRGQSYVRKGQRLIIKDGRKYDVVTVLLLPDCSKQEFYFDITAPMSDIRK